MATEIDELKELVRRNTALAEETNHVVHKMRRSQRLHTIFQVIWWLTIVGITGAAYYYYLAPYIAQILEMYQNLQSGVESARGIDDRVADFFRQFATSSTQ